MQLKPRNKFIYNETANNTQTLISQTSVTAHLLSQMFTGS